MRSFNRSKLGPMDQINHLINEQYLLWEIKLIQDSRKVTAGKNEGNFNGKYFIKMNKLYKSFDEKIECLC